MSKKLLIFNWKMNPSTLREALDLARASDKKGVVVAPPFVFIEEIGKMLKRAELGAQDVAWQERGALTGEVSAVELKNLGVKYVIVGHSERRHKLGETDEVVAKKLKTAIDSGLIPILCVGETKKERDAGKKEEVIKKQLNSALSTYQLPITNYQLLIAYEPVWAIGAGTPETPESALETIKYIKSLVTSHWSLVTKVLYGGSVNSQNLGDYLEYKEVDGALVGGASLNPDEVTKMISILGHPMP